MPISLAGSVVTQAQALAASMLANVEQRWPHTCGVARQAERLAVTVPPVDREVLLASAWLHDIGYAPLLRETGFHPLDGATFLRKDGWPPRICGLVAHHSGADFAAGAHGLQGALSGYGREESAVADALTYADQTTGPSGQLVTLAERMAEMLARHGQSSVQARVHDAREPYLLAAAGRVLDRLARCA